MDVLFVCAAFFLTSFVHVSKYSPVSPFSTSSGTQTLCQVGRETPGIPSSRKASTQLQVLHSHPRHLSASGSCSSEPPTSRTPAARLGITPKWKGDWEGQRIGLRSRIPICGAAATLTSLRSQEFASSCLTQNNS